MRPKVDKKSVSSPKVRAEAKPKTKENGGATASGIAPEPHQVKSGFAEAGSKSPQPQPTGDDLATLAMLAGKGVFDLSVLKDDVREKVEKLIELGDGNPTDAAKFEAMYGGMQKQLGKESVATALEELAEVTNAGSLAGVAGENRLPASAGMASGSDQRDWHRDWGFSLLSQDNPRFRDGKYLIGWNQEAGQNRSHFMGRTSPSQAKRRFEERLREFIPNLDEVTYAGSGTDAVNLTLDVARRAGLARNKLIDWTVGKSETRPAMAFFDGVYAGGRGEALAMNWEHFSRGSQLDVERYKIPSPTTKSMPVTDPAEIARLEVIEKQAVEKLRQLAADKEHPIGAIFIEPIQGSRGVLCYRPEFMKQLRDLADELELPIVADEVLTSGGRTGKFFAYQHYQGFEPDYVTFGKGMQVNGVAHLGRRLPPTVGADGKKQDRWQSEAQRVRIGGFTTGEGSPGDFHKAAEVLTALKEDKLIERAAEVGKKLEKILVAAQQKARAPIDVTVFGALAGWQAPPGTPYGVVASADGGGRRRLMPPLDVTDETLAQVEKDFVGGTP